ncbi:hypothetical protein [uncultured Mediterranean phage uvDeep-CGR2-AD12-C183]|nr:hypothetical protein [uncultured Mediterranean phage uvDeep-CGR2-AD12-C183]
MIEVNTKPKAGLNVSKLAISLNSAAEFSMQFSVVGWGQYPGPDGKAVWGSTPIVSTLLSVSGAAWTNWVPGAAPSDADYIANLALAQLGLERDDTVVAVEQPAAEEAPAEEAVEEEPAE